MNTALANPVCLEDIERIRNEAIELFKESKRNHDEAHKLVSKAVKIISGTEADYEARFNFDTRNFDFDKSKIQMFIKGFDKSIWQSVYSTLKLSKIMDAQAKKEFHDTINTAPIEATAENLRSTVNYLQEESFTIFQRGLVNAFASLDRRFKSHDGFKLGSRIILSNYFTQWSHNYTTADKLNDVERIFYLLDNKTQPDLQYRPYEHIDGKRVYDMDAELNVHGMMSEAENWDAIITPYFKGRRFANGNLHLFFLRDDLLRKANLILALFYGEQIGASSEVCNPEDLGPDYLPTLKKDLAFYPTPKPVIDRMIEIAHHIKNGDNILEPSAGNGDIIDSIYASHYLSGKNTNIKVKAYELDATRFATLRGKGYDVTHTDFLSVTPNPIYDKIFLNPPFSRSRDVDHVTHALKFLKPGGCLVAVMSARAELSHDSRHVAFRSMIKRLTKPLAYRSHFTDLPPLSFKHAGTNVNTVILALTLTKNP